MWASTLIAAGELPPAVAPWVNLGVPGLLLLAIFFGWVWAKPSVDKVLAEKDASIERLMAERDRLVAEKTKAEEQRDAAIAIAQDKLVPLLVEFTGVTQTLIPLLQNAIREGGDDHRRR